jgi:hypothetical protein
MLGQAVRTQVFDGLLVDLLQDMRFLRVWMKINTMVVEFWNHGVTG